MASGNIKGITIEIAGNSSKLVKSLEDAQKAANSAWSNLKKVNQALKLDPGNIDALVKKQELLNTTIEATKQRLDAEKAAAEEAKKALDLGDITQGQYDAFEAQILKSEASLHDLEQQAIETKNVLDGVGSGLSIEEASGSVQDLHDKFEILNYSLETLTKVGDAAGAALSKGFDIAVAAAEKAAQAAMKVGEAAVDTVEKVGHLSYDISREVLDSYGNYEQLVGGVEKIFGDSADIVRANAAQAFQSATMSANDYMETITGFSASLLQGLNGDTVTAARLADQALRDMSDNANTYGTDIQSIISAYQGFAKGNYNMLDNLRLGYGGTKTEMIRLINDAGILNETISSLDNITFDQIIEAITAVQTQLNITGTTEREAASTIEGSINMLRASWANLMTDLGRSDIDAQRAAQNVANAIVTVADNVKPVLRRVANNLPDILPIILNNVRDDIPEAVEVAGLVMNAVGQAAVDAAPDVIDTIADNLPEATAIVSSLLRNISEGIHENADEVVAAFGAILPELSSLGGDILGIILQTFIENAPEAARQMANALAPAFDEVFGEGTGEKVMELIESGPQIASDVIAPLIDLTGTLIQELPTIADTAIPLMEFAAQHLPEIVGLLVGLKTTGVIASIGSGILSVASSVQMLSGTTAAIEGASVAASGAATSMSTLAATAGPIALLTAEVVALGYEVKTYFDLMQQAEEVGMSWSEATVGGILEAQSHMGGLASFVAGDFADAWYEAHRASEDALQTIEQQAQQAAIDIELSIEQSGAAATQSVADDCAVIQSYLDNLEANGQIELRARVITEYQTVMTTAANNNGDASRAQYYSQQGQRRNRQQAYANGPFAQADREMAERYRQQGQAAVQAIEETAQTAQRAITNSAGGGGGGGGGGGSSRKEDEETPKTSAVQSLLENIDASITKILEKFGIVTEQTDYQKNVNQMIDGLLTAIQNNYTDESIEAAMSEIARTMESFGMDSSVIDATTLEQLRGLVNATPQPNSEAFAQMQNSVQAIQAVTVDYTPHLESIQGSISELTSAVNALETITNVYIGEQPIQDMVVQSMNSYNYETGGH